MQDDARAEFDMRRPFSHQSAKRRKRFSVFGEDLKTGDGGNALNFYLLYSGHVRCTTYPEKNTVNMNAAIRLGRLVVTECWYNNIKFPPIKLADLRRAQPSARRFYHIFRLIC